MNDTEPFTAAPEMAPADSAFPGWLMRLPAEARPYAALARLDRPVGIWLLLLPCFMGVLQMRIPVGLQWIDILWLVVFTLGAIAMRGAGCTWNDITDRDADAQVARTAGRPIPSGQVTLRNAYLFLGGLLAIGFVVWLLLPFDAKIVALLAVPLVVIYPFLKRVTWWPQAWLGFTFNFGVLVGAATAASVTGANVVLYLGLVFWTVAYDTVYALQDREDDALAGVKSTARLFGDKVLTGVFIFHLAATAMISLGMLFAGAGRIGAATGLVFLAHGLWQVNALAKDKDAAALQIFKSNVWAGMIIVLGLLIAVLL